MSGLVPHNSHMSASLTIATCTAQAYTVIIHYIFLPTIPKGLLSLHDPNLEGPPFFLDPNEAVTEMPTLVNTSLLQLTLSHGLSQHTRWYSTH